MNELIDAWLSAQSVDVESSEYFDLSWAVDELFGFAHDDPDKLLSVIEDILEIDSSPKILGAIGAGVLEDLIVYHGNDYIDKIVDLAKSNMAFKATVHFTYIDRGDVAADVYEKLQQIKDNKNDKEK